MDRKSILIVAASFLLLLAWPSLMEKVYPPRPKPAAVTQPAGQPAATVAAPTTSTGATTLEPTSLPTGQVAPYTTFVRPVVPEKLLVLTNQAARYTFTSHGGGIKSIEMLEWPEVTACRGEIFTNAPMSLNGRAPVPAMALVGNDAIQGDGHFVVTHSGNVVKAEKALADGIYLIKTFTIQSNYLVAASLRFENRSDAASVVPSQEVVIGTATAMTRPESGKLRGVYGEFIKWLPQILRGIDFSQTAGVFWYNGKDAEHVDQFWFENEGGCSKRPPHEIYEEGANNVRWAAIHNQFFTLAAIPKEVVPRIVSRRVPLPPPSSPEMGEPAYTNGFQTAFRYPAVALPKGEALQRDYTIYAGPREYKRLSRLGHEMKNDLDLVMDFGFFGFFAKALLLSMNGLHSLGLSYGLCIIVITLIIKTLFWPLTQKGIRSMKRMQELAPQLKVLQEKYKDDPAKFSRKQIEFYKEHKINPISGCLPMLLQIPIFFAFWAMLRSAIELRGASFLWACDLSQADTIAVIPGIGFPINPFPILMGATMLIQANLTPTSPGMDPVQQKIMKYMPLIFMIGLYNYSAGLTLYWTIQNLITIIQTLITRTKPEPVAVAVTGKGQGGGPNIKKK